MWIALCALTLLAPLPAAAPQDAAPTDAPEATPLALTVDAVTLYRDSAFVHRRADDVASGEWVVRGLPGVVSDSGTRVRFLGGHVVSVELRERVRAAAPTERLETLRATLADARRAMDEASDEVLRRETSVRNLAALLDREARAWARQLASGAADTEAWSTNRAWFAEALAGAYAELRAAKATLEAKHAAWRALESEIGRLTSGGVVVQDLFVRVLTERESGTLEVDTRLFGAGWEPVYDLRASSDAREVELVHRARVAQSTGEDWTDVRVLLSTARPELGARGPDPQPGWVDLVQPDGSQRLLSDYRGQDDAEIAEEVEAPPAQEEASIRDEGLSVRYELPRRETIESREEPTTVLVGREMLSVEPELYCVPALARNVWLRGRATNGERWTLLPGEASVFFGPDYLGRTRLELVQPGQSFVVDLGVAPKLEVRRTRVEDTAEGPGFFGSKRADVSEWAIEIENHGTRFADPRGVATVIVREALPRAADDRIEVALEEESPKHEGDERWKRDLEDRSIHTWLLRAPRGGTARLAYRVSVRYPQSASVTVEPN